MEREMANGGFEQDLNTLKKRCSVGDARQRHAQCLIAPGTRISLDTDRRVFTPIDRASYKWEREYAHLTVAEGVNSRLDVSFGFELHAIRGLKKMQMRCGLAHIVMMAMALGRIEANPSDKLRSLVKSA